MLATNHLYDLMWVYYNLFQPVMHLAEKKVIQRAGRSPSVVRRHDVARTPFIRPQHVNAQSVASGHHRTLTKVMTCRRLLSANLISTPTAITRPPSIPARDSPLSSSGG